MAEVGDFTLRIRVDPDTGKLTVFNEEVESLGERFQNTTNSAEHLNSRLEHGLEHVGIHIVGEEMLRTAGIFGNARPIIALMNVAFHELTEAMGLTAAGLGMLTAGLTALAGAALLVTEARKKHAEAEAKAREEAEKAVETTQELIQKLEEYRSVVGTLPTALGDVYARVKDLSRSQREAVIDDLEKQMKAQERALDTKTRELVSLQASSQALQKERDAWEGSRAKAEEYDVEIGRQQDRIGELMHARRALQGTIDEERVKLDALASGYSSFEEKQRKATEAAKAEDEEIKKANDLMLERQKRLAEAARAEDQATLKSLEAERKKNEEQDKRDAAMLKEADRLLKEKQQKEAEFADAFKSVWTQAANTVGNALAGAAAKGIVEGKSFSETLKGLSKEVTEQIIADLIKVAVQAAITSEAVKGIFLVP